MIKIAIAGYGNLGRGVESAVGAAADMKLTALFTRREPASIQTATGVPVYRMDAAPAMKREIDVMILCGGSAKDLPEQTPLLAKHFNVVDSFDTHTNIPGHFDRVDAACKDHGTVGIISVGWDPGLFSLSRLIGQAVLPDGGDYTFWGRGVSQGHSDAIRRIPGVRDARQYTIPIESAVERVRAGEAPVLSAREKHLRECFIVAEENADTALIEETVKTMPGYFADYNTVVHFISAEELKRDHAGIPHGGTVIRSGKTGADGVSRHVMEFRLNLDSNPEFTAGVLTAYARAAYRLSGEKVFGCKTVLDIAPAYLHPASPAHLRATLL